MNWLDIIMIILAIGIFMAAIVILTWAAREDDLGFGIISALIIFLLEIIPSLYFIVLDKGSGSTIGTITSIDKNFFGTTSLYIKTSENSQEIYCIEDSNIVEQAKLLIGKNVKIEYGERVGLYSTNKCHQAPVEKIEEIIEE